MSMWWEARRRGARGFTVVEIVVAIIVIAILAAIAVPSYIGVQKKAATAAVVSTLKQVSNKLTARKLKDDSMTATLDEVGVETPEVQLTLVTSEEMTGPYYSNLTAPQNGYLFYDVCRTLVDEGLGNGPSDYGAGTVGYITSCRVFDLHYLQINGWNGGFNVSSPSVTKAMLQGYVDTGASANPGHPSYRATMQNFMDQLISRFESSGGSFPITEFWRPWIGEPVLPTPSTQTQPLGSGFCIIATHIRYPDISYVSTFDQPTPRAGTDCS